MINPILEYTSRYYLDKFILDSLGDIKDKSILDVGCGNGDLLYKFFDLGAKSIGIDASEKIINFARSKYPKLEFRVHDITKSPLERKFDFVVLELVIMFINEVDEMLDNIKLNMKDDARILISILHPDFVNKLQSIEGSLVVSEDILKMPEGSVDENYFARSLVWYRELFDRHGFELNELHESTLDFNSMENSQKLSQLKDLPSVAVFDLSINKS